MPAQGSGHAAQGSGHATHRPAFSLAELMIALVILGLGLLFIAAALPVGLEYTRQTVDLETAEATGEYALGQLELNLRTSNDDLYEPSLASLSPAVIRRLDNFHRARNYNPPHYPDPLGTYPLNEVYEPFFKVRPFVMGNVRFGNTGGYTRVIVDDVESAITACLVGLGMTLPMAPLETDFALTGDTGLSLAENPALPGLARVYPPIEAVTTFSVANFFNNDDAYPTYGMRFGLPDQPDLGSLSFDQQNNECEKGLERRVGWTAFYRRVSYRFVDPDTPPVFDGDEYAEDPLTYELIIVVTRRTSLNHRFPRQNVTNNALSDFEQPTALSPDSPPIDDSVVGTDRLAPTPWLVIFDRTTPDNDGLPRLDPSLGLYDATPGADRTLFAGFSDPPTLTFRCTREVGVLLPVGSIFIPAFNDARYAALASSPGSEPRQSGFVPHAPEALPIYEVVEVIESSDPDGSWSIVVKNNGYYPWVRSENANDTQAWPVWVIPPAFVERDSEGQPIYERTSPILQVVRRTVTLHEMRP